VLGVKEVG
jgi:hypothetical protein